jgi:hypothetical protein
MSDRNERLARCHFRLPASTPRLTREGDLLAAEACLVANHGAGAPLALQAVAHGDTRWFPLNREVKLSATAGGASGAHGGGSVAVGVQSVSYDGSNISGYIWRSPEPPEAT